ncbi:MAG: TerC/Alx family metal homeostasis membrane protein [Thermoflavifilum sp.]|uniref:TerC/Alx family metal homeostasis membrane protein n=1 Tax=Thermoflavifilum sp. TaxID=1968839 RepID=UPI0018A47FCA|nr:TerC/Alx family metal homeostasis membrane protein [Thermoflavifilum sp.]QOR76471.1 MAG: TerC/Alx family metal homeostasis membrane protein [Thermoflavifilum sp.]
MSHTFITYLLFAIVLLFALIFDLGLINKKGKKVTLRMAVWQTVLWVSLSILFGVWVWFENGHELSIEYYSAYLMEWSLSVDNIFVFILIFAAFDIDEKYYGRVLIVGILMAIILRILFIFVGISLVSRFHWILYLFGAFLVYTGLQMFLSREDKAFNADENRIYRFLKSYFPVSDRVDEKGNFFIRESGKRKLSRLGVVVGILAGTDVVFAVDSIPAVLAISQDKLVVYTSNIFAVLGLRSLFFLLQGAVNRFTYLQQGVSVILVFIGLKMLVGLLDIHIPTYVSLLVIVLCISISIGLSMLIARRHKQI